MTSLVLEMTVLDILAPTIPSSSVRCCSPTWSGFTEYNEAVGDIEALRVLDEQRSLVDGHLDGQDARLVKEIGDGLMIWIGSAVGGLSIATCLLEAFAGIHESGTFPLAVRMGMHHGESIARGDDLVGQTVNVAARISALAGPGELLVSQELLAACGSATRDRRSVRLDRSWSKASSIRSGCTGSPRPEGPGLPPGRQYLAIRRRGAAGGARCHPARGARLCAPRP